MSIKLAELIYSTFYINVITFNSKVMQTCMLMYNSRACLVSAFEHLHRVNVSGPSLKYGIGAGWVA